MLFCKQKNPLKIFPKENNTNQCLPPEYLVFSNHFQYISPLPLITLWHSLQQLFKNLSFDSHYSTLMISILVLGHRFGFGHATFLNASFGLYFCDLQCEWGVHYKYNWGTKQSKSKSTLECPIICQSDFDNFYSKVKKMGFYGTACIFPIMCVQYYC